MSNAPETVEPISFVHTLFKAGDIGVPINITDANGNVVIGLCRVCFRTGDLLKEPCVIGEIPQSMRDHLHRAGVEEGATTGVPEHIYCEPKCVGAAEALISESSFDAAEGADEAVGATFRDGKLEKLLSAEEIEVLMNRFPDFEGEPRSAATILDEAAETFRERNAIYKNNFLMVGNIMAAMFPEGVTLKTPDDHNRFHLFMLKVVKLSRFTISGMTHVDSIRDDLVYSAMVEALTNENSPKIGAS